jgi:hypothetical protein
MEHPIEFKSSGRFWKSFDLKPSGDVERERGPPSEDVRADGSGFASSGRASSGQTIRTVGLWNEHDTESRGPSRGIDGAKQFLGSRRSG